MKERRLQDGRQATDLHRPTGGNRQSLTLNTRRFLRQTKALLHPFLSITSTLCFQGSAALSKCSSENILSYMSAAEALKPNTGSCRARRRVEDQDPYRGWTSRRDCRHSSIASNTLPLTAQPITRLRQDGRRPAQRSHTTTLTAKGCHLFRSTCRQPRRWPSVNFLRSQGG